MPQWLPLVAIGVLFYFLMIRPQGREKKKRQELLDALKKNDKIVTIGGILGSIASISSDSDEVTIKVDENIRLRVLRSSIQRVVSTESESDNSSGS
jgi:preprotein translocase subunit YajC